MNYHFLQRSLSKIWHLTRYQIPYFFRNIYFFRKELWQYNNFDYIPSLMLFKRSLIDLRTSNAYYSEIHVHGDLILNQMDRVIEILTYFCEDQFKELAEKELNKKYTHISFDLKKSLGVMLNSLSEQEEADNHEIMKLENKIQQDAWIELWSIIQGSPILQKYLNENEGHDDQIFDGTDMRNWWN